MADETTEANNARTLLAVGVVLAIVGFLLIVIVVYVIHRKRREYKASNGTTSLRTGPPLSRNHPALRIVPFGSPEGEGPKFVHIPGSNMRIASRRSDGGWDFSDPRAPFTPSGVSEISPTSSSFSRSRETLILPNNGPYTSYTKSSSSRKARMAYEDCVPYSVPPPAYARENRDAERG